jgi:hypothetical protein
MTTVITLLHFPQEQALDFKSSRVCYLVLAHVAHTINKENVCEFFEISLSPLLSTINVSDAEVRF